MLKKAFLFFILVAVSGYTQVYTIGVGDILEVNIIQPDKMDTRVTVSPGGDISVPYIGSVYVKGRTIYSTQNLIQQKLASGYLKYPVVTVSLVESRSRSFTISGEVIRPGNYALMEIPQCLKQFLLPGDSQNSDHQAG
jgi:polysaccharide export outer membrane protein